jgi:hypothetical protein
MPLGRRITDQPAASSDRAGEWSVGRIAEPVAPSPSF